MGKVGRYNIIKYTENRTKSTAAIKKKENKRETEREKDREREQRIRRENL